MDNIINIIIQQSKLYDFIVIHSDILYLLKKYGANEVKKKFNNLFLELINENKTVFIPTFNCDYCSTKLYDYKNNKSTVGTLSKWCLESDLFIRINDPLYSFAVAGNKQNYFKTKYYNNAFGKESIFELFDKNNTVVVMLNNQNFTMVHYYEQLARCPFRYIKKFMGDVHFENKTINNFEYEMNVKYLDVNIDNTQYKQDSFLNKYIDGCLISRYSENDKFIIDFINIPKIRNILLNDLVYDPFLCLQNKSDVKLYCSNKLICIINKFIEYNLNKKFNINEFKQHTLKEIGLTETSIKMLSNELINNNFYLFNNVFLFKNKINDIINMNVNKNNINDIINMDINSKKIDIFYKLIYKYSSIQLNNEYDKYKDNILEHLEVDSLGILQIQSELIKNNINIDLDSMITQNINYIVNKINSDDELLVPSIPEINNSKLLDSIVPETSLNNNQKISIISTGHCVGNKVINNKDLEIKFNLEDGWIKKRTGIESRYILDGTQNPHELIINACNQAIKDGNINPKDIDLLILATSTPNSLYGDASIISHLIHASNASCFDISVACNGFVTALVIASQFIENSNSKYALVIGTDCLSRWVDWDDKSSCTLFGDGAGVVILKSNDTNTSYKKINYILQHKGNLDSSLNIPNETKEVYNDTNISLYSNDYTCIKMKGSDIYNFAVESVGQLINDLLIKSNLKKEEIKYFLLHQANIRIINQIATNLDIDINKFLTNISKFGNTSAGSIPILLNESYQKNIFKKGDLIMMVGFGAGANYGGIIMTWDKLPNLNYSLEYNEFNKKIALIIGGTSGIGLSIGKKLSNNNYHVILASRSDRNDIEYNDNIEYYKLDINNCDNLKELNEYITTKYNKLDLLVNSAGWEGLSTYSIDTNIEDINKIINVNLTGVIYSITILINLLKKSKAIIINVSSLFAANPLSICYKRNLYSMTKAAIASYTRGLSGELKNICEVYSINPSFVNTDMVERIGNDNNIDKNILNYTTMIECDDKRLIEPEEISDIVYLLINKQLKYKSGDEIIILPGKKTSHMKYLYDEITNRDSKLKISLVDIVDISLIETVNYKKEDINKYVCIFQGQGFKNDYIIHKKESYEVIIKNNYHNKFKNITNLDFFETIENLKKDINNTYYQQLIIFMYSIIGFELLKSENNILYKQINTMIGYSLGEYSALVCSGKISFEDGLKLVNLRAIEMKRIASTIDTGMLKIIGINEILINKYLTNNIYVSNDICDNIKIISGDKNELNQFKKIIEQLNISNIKFYELNVDGAFHTKYFDNMSDYLEKILKTIKYNDTYIQVISNYENQHYTKDNYINLLKKQVCNKVEWNNIIKSLNNTIKWSYEICVSKSSLNNLFNINKSNLYSIQI
jgi:3-oxoacyl-[acyl-carrier-protein] synthase III